MDHDRSNRAMARIETALRRIEAAGHGRTDSLDEAEFQRLRTRHDRLRAAVQDSLHQLDQLIEGAGQ